MNTYDQQKRLVNLGLAREKVEGDFTTFKYNQRAMWDYKWFEVPELMECRGHVYDNDTKELVQAAPRKMFNLGENGWWRNVKLSEPVRAFKKINGYMAAATMHKGKLVVSTTGTTTSEYAQWARKLIEDNFHLYDSVICSDATTLFEVVLEDDPHIVKERLGLHLLGVRQKDSGIWWPMGECINGTLADIMELARHDRGEGFVVYNCDNYLNACKIKTEWYAGKKKLMRMSDKNVKLIWDKPELIYDMLPDEWKPALNWIGTHFTEEQWIAMGDQERRRFLESRAS